jgi:hypothetical protein
MQCHDGKEADMSVLASDPPQSRPGAPERPQRSLSLPAKVTVSLRAGVVLALANVLCALILAGAWTKVRTPPKTIKVTGSAKKQIVSDLIVWRSVVSVNEPDLEKAYDVLKSGTEKTLAYLTNNDVPEDATTVLPIAIDKHYARDESGNSTDQVSSYNLSQTVEVTSHDVVNVAQIARRITELIKDGVQIESQAPSFHYTKLADLKVAMLAEATKDATDRARQIAENSGAQLGAIRTARMGVMQINPIHSNEVSGYGNNDTSSYEKEIMAVVGAEFALQ